MKNGKSRETIVRVSLRNLPHVVCVLQFLAFFPQCQINHCHHQSSDCRVFSFRFVEQIRSFSQFQSYYCYFAGLTTA